MEAIRPQRLREGDTVAVLSMSWGGPAVFPAVFDAGCAVLTERFGLRVREYPTTRAQSGTAATTPQARAADLHAALADESVAAIIASIGGDDSALLLPHLDADVFRAHPKILLGYSDTATLLTYANQLGMVTFNGPAVMAGFAQLPHFPAAEAHVRALLMEPTPTYDYRTYPQWVDAYADWNGDGVTGEVGELHPHDGWHWLNGSGRASGRLFGGCVEVLEFLKGSRWWPTDPSFWDDRILFLETSEDCPTVDQLRYWLFNYGVQGVFDRASALLIGRARGYSDEQKLALDEMVHEVVVGQFGATDLCVVTNLDFGHTDPQWILPLGVRAELDSNAQTFRLLEPAVS